MSYTSGRFAEHARQVLQDDHDGTPANTARAYDPKAKEWVNYCDHTYHANGSEVAHTSKYLVTEEKFFGFLFYQSRRPKRSPGKPVIFNGEEYNEYISDPSLIAKNPVGWSCINQYRSAVMLIFQNQIQIQAREFLIPFFYLLPSF